MNIKDSFKERFNKVSTPKKSKWIEEIEKNKLESMDILYSSTFSQPSFASNMTSHAIPRTAFGISSQITGQLQSQVQSGQISSNPRLYAPFQLLDELDKAMLVKEFLISRGIKKVSKEVAKALFLVNEELVKGRNKDQVLPIQKQAKKKLTI